MVNVLYIYISLWAISVSWGQLWSRLWIVIKFWTGIGGSYRNLSSAFSCMQWDSLISARWIGTKLCTDTHGSWTMSPNDLWSFDFSFSATVRLMFWLWVKYQGNYWVDCCKICYTYSRSQEDKFKWLWWSLNFSFSTISRSKFQFA